MVFAMKYTQARALWPTVETGGRQTTEAGLSFMRRKRGETQSLDKHVGILPEPEEGAAQSGDEGRMVIVPS